MSDTPRFDIARDSIHIPPSSVDAHGMVTCWSPDQDKWLVLWPIDARERLATGELTLESPGGDSEESTTLPPEAEREAAFGKMPKAKLRTYCVENNVDHTGSDTKVSLVKRLVTAGVIPK